jgi:hypothetical protein
MSSRASIERVRFVHGQRLQAADLGAGAGLRLQELHVVAAHGTWGVALGLDVRAGMSGARVSPGLAYDAFGRALLLPRAASVTIPAALAAASEAADLVLSWATCAPVLRLALPADTQPGLDVTLARFWVEEGALGDPDLSYRRCARSLAAPRIGSGSTSLDVSLDGRMAVYTEAVDTSAAGFDTTPAYAVTPSFDTAGDLARALLQGALGPFVSVSNPASTSFTVEVRMDRPDFAEGATAFTLGLAWLGVEAAPSCPTTSPMLEQIEVPQ